MGARAFLPEPWGSLRQRALVAPQWGLLYQVVLFVTLPILVVALIARGFRALARRARG